jgi:hypothetical protein
VAKEKCNGNEWKETQYWYLEIFSCVTVRRNRAWFDAALPTVEKIWKTVVEERANGHEHRAPKKRSGSGGGSSKSVLQNYIVNKLDIDT